MSISARAVIIVGGDGSGNTTSPTGDQGWSNVGRVNTASSSVTYVGNDWFLTGWHVKQLDSPTQAILNGSTYDINASSWTRLTTGGNDADAALFRVNTSVSEADATLYTGTLSVGDQLTMTGNGHDRQATGTTWYVDVDEDPFVWNESDFPESDTTASGFKWDLGGTSKRWGTNEFEGTVSALDTGYGISETFYTVFDSGAGGDEAQGATFDSGGGVFVDDGGVWSLVGMIVTRDRFSGQPNASAVYGNRTYMVDLREYNAQIASVIAVPEASSLILASLLIGVCWIVVRRSLP